MDQQLLLDWNLFRTIPWFQGCSIRLNIVVVVVAAEVIVGL